jgi:hypothetical protein
MKILVTGSRDWTDRKVILDALMNATRITDEGPIVVIQGGAAGADRIANVIATSHCWQPATLRANWNAYGNAAGHIRNSAMVFLMLPVEYGDVCLAFINPCIKVDCPVPQPHDSHGVANCISQARKAGIPVREYRNG